MVLCLQNITRTKVREFLDESWGLFFASNCGWRSNFQSVLPTRIHMQKHPKAHILAPCSRSWTLFFGMTAPNGFSKTRNIFLRTATAESSCVSLYHNNFLFGNDNSIYELFLIQNIKTSWVNVKDQYWGIVWWINYQILRTAFVVHTVSFPVFEGLARI